MATGVLDVTNQRTSLSPDSRSKYLFILGSSVSIDEETRKLISHSTVSVTAPGLAIATDDQYRRYGYGINIKHPHNAITTDINIRVLLDSKGKVLNYFHEWLRKVIPATNLRVNNKRGNYLVNYPSSYRTTATIMFIEPTGSTHTEYKLHNLYPTYISDVEKDWGASNDATYINVRLTYSDYEVNTVTTSTTPKRKEN